MLVKRVLQFIENTGICHKSGLLLVGVSGGPDSVCLVHILSRISIQLEMRLQVVHFNHKLRGTESEADAEYVSQLAKNLKLPLILGECDVRAFQKSQHCSLEEAAREARYSFFADVASNLNAVAVAVGHTADDQVETILMHLIRGAGLKGLRGMEPITIWRSFSNGLNLKIVRPLLEISREETEVYCKTQSLSPRQDSSNKSLTHFRNRIRLELIPLLQDLNPSAKATLLRFSKSATDDIDFIQNQILLLWNEAVREEIYGFVLDLKKLSKVHLSLKKYLLYTMLGRMLGNTQDIESSHIENMVEILGKPVGKMISLPRGITFYRDYKHCLLLKRNADWCPFPAIKGEYELNIPGETLFSCWQVRGSILEQKPADVKGNFRAFLDLRGSGKKLVVRTWRAGDKFQPLGMAHSKKLRDFIADAKIPRHWRSRVPLVTSGESILWVVGWRISEIAKITASTRQILFLEFERQTSF